MLAGFEDEETVKDVAEDVGDAESADVTEERVKRAERIGHRLDAHAQKFNRDIVRGQAGEEKPCKEEEGDNVNACGHPPDNAILDELDKRVSVMGELFFEERNHGRSL